MSDAYEDDLERSGTGLAAEKGEGEAITIGSMTEGALTRYNARTFALMVIVSEEAIEDVKYKEVIGAAKSLGDSMDQTCEVDAALQLVRGWDSNYVGGDGVELFSTAHPLPESGTYSNNLATAMTPSVAAITVMQSQAAALPGKNGVRRKHKLVKVLHPVEQEMAWESLTKSDLRPEDGNFADINIVKKSVGLSHMSVTHWDTTTTNWCATTDADLGFRWKWRVRPKNRSWANNDYTEMRYAVRARWSRGWTNARGAIGSQA
jgi:hypothetical protein